MIANVTNYVDANMSKAPANQLYIPQDRRRLTSDIFDGAVVCFSDAHYWPDVVTVAHQALIEVCREIQPKMVIANGDILDGARIGRHARIGWEHKPSLKQEMDAARERMAEVQVATPKAVRVWNWGNHDIRFDSYIANSAPETEGLHGVSLADHFPAWHFGWSLMLNESLMVKHRYHGGIHTAYNNTVKAGLSMMTGHTHALEVKPWGDYNGRRYGIQDGTLTDRDGPQFTYAEDSPSAQNSGFAVVTFDSNGFMLPPELCEVIGDAAFFRGQRVV
jgi:hypothetical protein